MTRTLVTINGIGVRNRANLAYLTAWKRFLDRNAKDLDCDFLFVNNCFDQSLLEAHLKPYTVMRLKSYTAKSVVVPFDTESSYWPIKLYNEQYDYILRVDHDAFPTVASLRELITKPPQMDADFVSASNFPRPIEHDRTNLKELDNRFVPASERSSWSWFPWGYPTHNSDLYSIRTSFFREVEHAYSIDPYIKRNAAYNQCPFHTSVMPYGMVCKVMGKEEQRYHDTDNVRIHIDGSINSDWWTYMCSLNPKYVGVVGSKGGSFTAQNHIIRAPYAMTFSDFNAVEDENDTSFPHAETITAPYFHLGNGYLSEWYLDPKHPELGPSYVHAAPHFKKPPFGSYVAHYAITSMFALLCNEGSVQSMSKQMHDGVFLEVCEDIPALHEYIDDVRHFYSQTLEDYL